VSFPDLADPGPAAPAPPLDELILAALAGGCLDAITAGDGPLAAAWEAAYTQVAAGSAAWCDLTTALQAGNN
jgi:hypothetical protein